MAETGCGRLGRVDAARCPPGVAGECACPRRSHAGTGQKPPGHPHLVLRQREPRRQDPVGDERVFPPHRPQPPCALRGHFLEPGIPRYLRYGKPDVHPGGRHQKVSGRAPGKALYHVRVQPRHGQQLWRHHRLYRVCLRRAAISGRVHLGVHGPRHRRDKPGRQARLCLRRRLW